MKRIKILVSISILVFLSSCNSGAFEEHEIGDNLIGNSTEVSLIDTFTIESSTVKMDSVVTSGQKNILFGKYDDPYFGKVNSDFYGVLGLGDSFNLRKINVNGVGQVDVHVKFDSLVFIVYSDKRYYGDTLAQQSISIHKVIEEIKYPDNEFAFYGHRNFAYEAEDLCNVNFFAKPVTQSVYNTEIDQDAEANDGGIRFRMDDELGLDIIKRVNNTEDDTVRDSNKWKKYFNGIVLKPGQNNTVMLSFPITDSKMKMRLYYSDAEYDEVGVSRFHDFPVLNTMLAFSNYTSDKSSTPQNLGRIVDRTEELSSDSTDNLTFIQGGIGFMTKVRIPYLEKLNTLGLTGGILKSELILYPKDDSFDSEQFKLPSSSSAFNIYTTNADNMTLSSILNPVNNQAVASVYNFNREYPDESYYSIDITNYVNNVLLSGQNYDDALLLSLPIETIGNSMERMVIENDPKSDFRIRLKTTYVVQK
ncbi:DUF4270 family protein [Ancylomarina salipaludis]|nr:DUF4270 family protein [Ancylomarina salipaludis]